MGPEKIRQIRDMCELYVDKEVISKRKLQAVLGKLLYISKVIKPARGFLNRILNTLRSMGHRTWIAVDDDFRKDMLWFRNFVSSFNGSTTFANWAGPHDVEIHVDASLMGLGAIWDEHFYSVHLPVFVKERDRIVVFEMLNVLLAMRVWGRQWTDRRVLIWCDNRAVVDVIKGGRTRDRELGAILREILMVQAVCNI